MPMTTVTSAVDAFMAKLVDELGERDVLEGVQLASGWLGGDAAANESIQLTDARSSQEWAAQGNKRKAEDFTIDGMIWVLRAGKNEPVIREARARAFALLAEIEDCLRLDPSLGGTVKLAAVSTYELEQGANQKGRWCQLSFEIAVKQDLRSS